MTVIQTKQMGEKPNRQVLKDLQDIFFMKLERKTGWGKEELKREFLESMNEALLNEVDRHEMKSVNVLENLNTSEDEDYDWDKDPLNRKFRPEDDMPF